MNRKPTFIDIYSEAATRWYGNSMACRSMTRAISELTPTGTNLLGMVEHLAGVEWVFRGHLRSTVRQTDALDGGRRAERGHVGNSRSLADRLRPLTHALRLMPTRR